MERVLILWKEGVLPTPLLTAETQAVASSPPRTTLSDSERNLILQTLETAGWVIGGPNGAAAKLGLKRTPLIPKSHNLGISRPVPHQQASDWPARQPPRP